MPLRRQTERIRLCSTLSGYFSPEPMSITPSSVILRQKSPAFCNATLKKLAELQAFLTGLPMKGDEKFPVIPGYSRVLPPFHAFLNREGVS